MSWRLNAGNETEVMDARGRNVARAHCGGAYGVKLDEAEAHARLIAAAPDMLAVLEGAIGILGIAESNASGNPEWDYVGPRVAACRAAIARAKGEA